ncbi:phage regulatory CII family protein [Pseudochrobactrum sp. MP213Fo]|uniref:phage regulatory CII family protein n=1 Tax=Pseudochrobactrum sp. MP213Fo TaxID=3022250 RepID=UPI003BA19C5F
MSVLRPTSEQQRRQLKATVRRLLELAGGVTSFEHVTRVKAPALSKYGSPDDTAAHMPVDVAMDLMLDTGSNGIVSAMAAMLGYKLVALESDGQGAVLPTITDIAHVVRDSSDVVDALAHALTDGKISAAEEREISNKIEKSVQDLRVIQRKAKEAATGGAS